MNERWNFTSAARTGGARWSKGCSWFNRGLAGAAQGHPLDLDTLARDLARGLSRREALARLGGGLAGMLLGALGLERVWAQGNSAAAHFCQGVFPPGPGRGQCVSDAAACTSGDATACARSVFAQCGPGSTTGRQLCGVSTGQPVCCPLGQTCCGDVACFDLRSDPLHCGNCTSPCGADKPQCCGGTCTNTATDKTNCGTCGMSCGGLNCCAGQCSDPSSDANNCGACGTICPSRLCVGGACTCSDTAPCPAGRECVGGRCLTPCPAGQTRCGSTCTSLQTDSNNCGVCGTVCPSHNCTAGICTCGGGIGCPTGQFCFGGVCVTSCPTGTTDCGGTCINTFNDASNCGACSVACPSGVCSGGACTCVASSDCPSGAVCVSGRCMTGCPNGQTRCGSTCVDTQTDQSNCGGCGTACPSGACSGGACSCGAAAGGAGCPGTQVCSGGRCVPACPSGQTNCGGTCTDLTSDASNCGACSRACVGGARICCGGNCITGDGCFCCTGQTGGVCCANGTICCSQGPGSPSCANPAFQQCCGGGTCSKSDACCIIVTPVPGGLPAGTFICLTAPPGTVPSCPPGTVPGT